MIIIVTIIGELHAIWALLDLNSDGQIDYTEFLEFMRAGRDAPSADRPPARDNWRGRSAEEQSALDEVERFAEARGRDVLMSKVLPPSDGHQPYIWPSPCGAITV